MMSEEEAMLGRASEPHPFLKLTENSTLCFWCGESENLEIHQQVVVTEVAKVLAAHRAAIAFQDGEYLSNYGCACGGFVGSSDEEHEQHVARAIYVHLQTRLEER